MRITYCEGDKLSLAVVNKITCSGSTLICQLAALDPSGKPELVIRPFPNEEICEDFFRQVICTTPEDGIINLENTTIDTRLGEIFDELDSLYED